MRIAALLVMLAVPLSIHADALAWVEARIAKRFAVPQMTVAEAQAALRAAPNEWLVLDVREPEEFALSHLPSAVRVDPGLSVEEFSARYSEQVAGKTVLLYCAVGQRSSQLGEAISDSVDAAGGQGVANLQGGIFRWQAEGGALVNATGPADEVHPYNWFWGLLRPRQSAN
ncbi:rhodanese-like domain-containing protein [bacterium]|nr:rhodanese-like domain-containing protein [bacterium]